MRKQRRMPLAYRNNFRVSGSSAAAASFSATLLSSLIPQVFTGSSTPTFTRATTAYVTDFEGLLKQVPSGASRHTGARYVRNLVLTKSEDMTAASWTSSNTTKTATTTTATAINGITYNYSGAPLGAGTYTLRVKLARLVGTGDIQLSIDNAAFTTVAITATPTVYSITTTTAFTGIYALLRFAVSGDSVSATEWQLERVDGQTITAPSEYVSVGVLSAPFHGAGVDGVKYFATQNGNTVSSNVVTEATGAAISSSTLLGYQAEGARTNLCLQSQTFGTNRTPQAVTVTSDTTVAPDGTTTADTLTTTGTNNIASVYQGGVVANTTTQTFSCYVKAGTCSYPYLMIQGSVAQNFVCKVFDLTGGTLGETKLGTNTGTLTDATITAVGSGGWYRITMTGQITDATRYFLVGLASAATGNTFNVLGDIIVPGTPNITLRVWGAQAETAAFASSYIPTTTVAVTRNADVLTYACASNLDLTVGTAVITYTPVNATPGIVSLIANANGGQEILTPRTDSGSVSLQTYDGTNNPVWTVSAFAANTTCKVATAWSGVTQQSYKDGALGTAAATTFDGNFSFGANFGVAHEGGGRQPFGPVKNLVIYTTRKTNAECQALTT